MMNRKESFTLIVCTLLMLMPVLSFAQKLPRNKNKREIAVLKARLDSLSRVLEDERKAAHERDSVAQEMLGIYEENENRNGFILDPADFNADVTDSLLDIWYLHRKVKDVSLVEDYDMDSVHLTSAVSDADLKQRLEKLNSFITLPYNDVVRNYMILYSEKMPSRMSSIMTLARYYMPIFEQTFSEYGLPDELKYVAIIESALNPIAVSRAKAVGMWQFMVRTAKSYGLEVSTYVDERRDPFKSADAAARYLLDLYKIFGDWNLAISSYNCGPGNVNKAIRRSGSREYWGVYKYLPRETRGYVPAFVGAMYAMKYNQEYGLAPSAMEMPAQVDTFEIRRNLHFQQISDLVGISVDELRQVNPQYVKDMIPGGSKTYILRLPYNYTPAFIANEDSLYTHKADIYLNPQLVLESSEKSGQQRSAPARIAYKVKKGDSLGRIASRHHVTVDQLKKWNHLRGTMISVGQTLYIYDSSSPSASTGTGSSTTVKSSGGSTEVSATVAPPAKTPGLSPTIYVVRKGDTLSKIASRYGVSVSAIKKYNGVGDMIHIGQKIKIPKKQ
jgi:FOG: LysM repeat